MVGNNKVIPINFINNSELKKDVKELFNQYNNLFEEIQSDNMNFHKYKIGDKIN